MNRQRAVSQFTNVKHNTKRHCPEDLSCDACCVCV
jgi:predicted RNase H-like nuclease (RuvC/YqgF family)